MSLGVVVVICMMCDTFLCRPFSKLELNNFLRRNITLAIYVAEVLHALSVISSKYDFSFLEEASKTKQKYKLS